MHDRMRQPLATAGRGVPSGGHEPLPHLSETRTAAGTLSGRSHGNGAGGSALHPIRQRPERVDHLRDAIQIPQDDAIPQSASSDGIGVFHNPCPYLSRERQKYSLVPDSRGPKQGSRARRSRVRGSRVRGSRVAVRGSRVRGFAVRGSWFVVRGSWFPSLAGALCACCEKCVQARRSGAELIFRYKSAIRRKSGRPIHRNASSGSISPRIGPSLADAGRLCSIR
jgi:hypothetical protein